MEFVVVILKSNKILFTGLTPVIGFIKKTNYLLLHIISIFIHSIISLKHGKTKCLCRIFHYFDYCLFCIRIITYTDWQIKEQQYSKLTCRTELFSETIFSIYSLFHIPLSWIDGENVNIQPSFKHFGIQSWSSSTTDFQCHDTFRNTHTHTLD